MSNTQQQKSEEDNAKQGPYTESFYPRWAEESESETLTTDEEIRAHQADEEATPIQMETSKSDVHVQKDHSKDDSEADTTMTCGVCFQILLDPISLGCGHSFCELCLAGMWKASRQPIPLCPMCRESWGRQGDRLPSVNVMLRDIIEKVYPKKLKERRESISEEERELLKSFSQARLLGTRPPGQANRRIGINIPLNRTFVFLLVFVFVGTMLAALLLVSGALWLIDLQDDYMLKPVIEWDNEDVIQWMKGLGESVKKDCMEVFEREKIDGPHLLSLSDKSLSMSLGVIDQFTRESLLLSINELKRKERPMPRNFKEFRAVNREEMMLVTFLYNFHPRLTFLYLYLFKYKNMFLPLVRSQLNIRSNLEAEEGEQGVLKEQEVLLNNELFDEVEEVEELEGEDFVAPNKEKPSTKAATEELLEPTNRQLIAIAIEILLVPHVVVIAFVYAYFSKDSVLFFALVFHCGMSTFVELKLLRNRLRHPRGRDQYSLSQILRTVRNQVIGYFITFSIGSLVYLILPTLLLDLLFFGMLFRPLLVIMYSFVLKPCIGRTARLLLVHFNQRAQRGVV